MLKAYAIRHAPTGDYDTFESVLVYHEHEEGARKMGGPYLSTGAPFEETEAERAPEHDERCAKWKRPCREKSDEYLRDHGWQLEDELRCASCGQAPFGIDKYAVCNDCHQCAECGCETDVNGSACANSGVSCG